VTGRRGSRRARRRHHGPAKRLLIAPALLLLILIVGLQQLDALHPRPLDPELALDPAELPVVRDRPSSCRRQHPETIERARPSVSSGGRVTSAVVLGCPAAYDGVRVTYVGELVGDLLRREGGAWVLVNDDDYALQVGPLPGHRVLRGTNSGLSVWLPEPLTERVTGLGRPNQRGDLVEVTGRISRADPTDGEGLTLRADRLQILDPARAVHEPLDRPQLGFAIGASVLAGVLWGLRRRVQQR
jgi:hypothetical protein